MGWNHKRECDGRSWRLLLALLCVLLVAVSGVVQAAHSHSDGSANHADCSLCVVSHVTVQLVQTPVPAPAISVIARVEAVAPSFAPSALSTFALFTRPPPAV
jgi:di/tricarboxylate transporter